MLSEFQGCYRLVKNFVVDNIQAIGLGVAVAGVIHGLGIVLACILARNVSKAEYEELRCAASSGAPAASSDKSRQPMLSTASRPQTASNGGNGGGTQYMQQQQPPPVIADSKELKKSKQKLKQTKASKAERRAKRAQSIDWTNADNHSSAAATLAHTATSNMPVETSMANHEDYYRDVSAAREESSIRFQGQKVSQWSLKIKFKVSLTFFSLEPPPKQRRVSKTACLGRPTAPSAPRTSTSSPSRRRVRPRRRRRRW